MLNFDFLIIGSGFGGSVSAMRLAQKGYRVAVLETGRRWTAKDFPKSNWILHRYFWIPMLRFFGPQRITLLKGVMVLHGTGVGGGSLIYANTLMKPESDIFSDPAWPQNVDWQRELEPCYEEARHMLGVTTNPALMEGEQVLRQLSRQMGVEDSYHPTEVGVFFGEPEKTVSDPYFLGKGPARTGCVMCGGCMVGCRYGAKNTLDTNYLFFAQAWGAKVFPETSATKIIPFQDGYDVETMVSTSWFKKKGPTFRSKKVILAAGVLGTVELLLKNKEEYKTLPNISDCLGERVRTNGESLLGATSFEAHRDLSQGIAIGASFFPNDVTRIEGVRYPSGSGAMRLLGVPLTSGGSGFVRPLKMLLNIFLRLPRIIRLWKIRDWAKQTLILLVMQTIDHKIKLKLGRSLLSGFRKTLRGTSDEKLPSYMPVAQRAAQELAEIIHGEPQNVISEVLLGTPATAHILGGCSIGDDVQTGVINSRHEVFGYPGLYVCDGSVMPCNLGVNPSLTITALAERFTRLFPDHPDLTDSERQRRKIAYSTR